MATVYCSASKNGREIEQMFSTGERAEADDWDNEYYLGCVVELEVSEEEFTEVYQADMHGDKMSAEWDELSQLEKYRTFVRGMKVA